MSSSSSAATALSRSRSLRQPGGRGGQVDDRENKTSTVNAEARLNSPSKLPKFGSSSNTTTTTTTTAAAAGTTRTRAGTTGARTGIPSTSTPTTTTRSRPNSGIFGLNRSNSIPTRKPAAKNDATEQAETTRTVRPAAMSSRLTRPKSISTAPKGYTPPTSSRPGPATTASTSASAAKPQSPITKTHTRTKSHATSLTNATTLRPPRPPSAGSVASTSTANTTATAASKRPIGRSNTTNARSVRQEQTSTSSSANTSTLNASSLSNTTTTSTTNPSRAAKPTISAATDDASRLRPAFTSFQQHYSPARNLAPKPLTSTFLAPPSPSKLPANVAISSETARLQTELLQLHLLHRDADTVTAAWHASARDRLKMRFNALVKADMDVGKDEAALEETRNVAALAAWTSDGEDLENRVQALDGILSGLWSLGESGGRYARVVRTFEKWFEGMVAAVEARRRAGGVGALTEGNEVAFISELDFAWKEEVSQLARKLEGWRRQLVKLQLDSSERGEGQQSDGSSLARILDGCRTQAHSMLAELDLMEQMERDAISQEAAWIKRMNRDDDEADDTPMAGAIWRAF